MEFDMFFASDVIGVYKPAPITYQTTIKALQVDPAQCIMVAAHAYDLEAAATKYVSPRLKLDSYSIYKTVE